MIMENITGCVGWVVDNTAGGGGGSRILEFCTQQCIFIPIW